MSVPTTTIEVREKIIARAISQLGLSESPAYSNRTPYSTWYGVIGPWCAMFVSWCFFFSGLPLKISTEKGFAYCPYGVNWFKKNDAWASPDTKPKRGWVIFYDFIGRPSHTGIVEGIATDGRIVALEGNTNAFGSRTGGSVMRHHRKVASGIIGYGVINYTGTIKPTIPQEEDEEMASQEQNDLAKIQAVRELYAAARNTEFTSDKGESWYIAEVVSGRQTVAQCAEALAKEP